MYIKIKYASKTRRVFTLLVFISLCHKLKSQGVNNLVQNYSFEELNSCPVFNGSFNQINQSKFWYRIDYFTSPDYFNTCATNPSLSIPSNIVGYQVPKTGNAYAGFGVYVYNYTPTTRENIAVQLKQKLSANKLYCITLHVSLTERSRVAISNIGCFFKADSIKNFYPIPTPFSAITFTTPILESSSIISDTINWIKIQGTYLANGSEYHMGIGNFRNDANTTFQITKPISGSANYDNAYYYLDDVSVVEINPAKAAQQKTITLCAGSTYTLGTDSTWDATYSWQPTTGLSCSNCPNPIITPTGNITYYLTKQQCSATTKDSVYITIYNSPVIIESLSNQTLCANQTNTLCSDNDINYNYTWQPPLGLSCTNCAQPTITALSTITYSLTKSRCGYNTTATVNISIKPSYTISPKISLTNSISCLWDELNFTAINTPTTSFNYEWQPMNLYTSNTISNATASITNNTYYSITINNFNTTDNTYCPYKLKDSIYISIPDTCKPPNLQLPQVITITGDGYNDELLIKIPNVQSAKLTVFNRWGSEVYQTSNNEQGKQAERSRELRWNGTYNNQNLPTGTYFYLVQCVGLDGKEKVYKEFVVLMR